MDKERRFGKRWPLDSPAKIRLKYKNSNKNYECHINNLSLRGLQVFLKKPFPGPKILKITLFLPENITVDVRVQIISYKKVEGGGYLYNLAIIGVKEDGRDLINRLINKKFFAEMRKDWWKDTK